MKHENCLLILFQLLELECLEVFKFALILIVLCCPIKNQRSFSFCVRFGLG